MKDLVNRLAPDFVLPVVGGGRLTLSDWRGYVSVVVFWSADCVWSRRADVFFIYRLLTWGPKGVRIVGIASNLMEPEAEIRLEAQKRHINYPIVLDLGQKMAETYHAETTPTVFVVGRDGVIRYAGALDDAHAEQRVPKHLYVDQAVRTVLENRRPNPEYILPYGTPITRFSDGKKPA